MQNLSEFKSKFLEKILYLVGKRLVTGYCEVIVGR